jgi:hypothetical protein
MQLLEAAQTSGKRPPRPICLVAAFNAKIAENPEPAEQARIGDSGSIPCTMVPDGASCPPHHVGHIMPSGPLVTRIAPSRATADPARRRWSPGLSTGI